MASEWPTIRISDFSKSGTTESTTDVTKIVDEFHHLYNERLRTLELTNPGSTDLKINALEEWIRDLTEQNKMLVKTVENLEKNAIDRVDTLDCVLKSKAAEKQTVDELKSDVNSLVELMRRLREDGRYYLCGLNFFTLSYEDVFGESPPKREKDVCCCAPKRKS